MSNIAVLSDHQRALLTAAGAAPSVLNTQPWLFRFSGRMVELHADNRRLLRVMDTFGRQLTISCGAALHNLRVAARRLGYEPVVRMLPDPSRPSLLASVDLSRLRAPTATDERLYAAIGRRHTARGAYSGERLPAELVARLEEAAANEGGVLRALPRDELATFLDLVKQADAELRARPGVREELARWVGGDGAERSEGLPAAVLGLRDVSPRPAIRDFAPDVDVPGRPAGRSEAEPNLMLLSTYGDHQVNWLRAGQALQRVLLEVTTLDLVASFLSQPLEDEHVRSWVRDPGAPMTYPQMVLRVGHGAPGPASPRRPIDELLLA